MGLLAGFYEGMRDHRTGEILLLGSSALLMGLLPAWIAEQPVQVVLVRLLWGVLAILCTIFSLENRPA